MNDIKDKEVVINAGIVATLAVRNGTTDLAELFILNQMLGKMLLDKENLMREYISLMHSIIAGKNIIE
jgi:hypothetical protein